MSGFMQWFNNLQRHEQLMLVGCSTLVILYLLYLLLWSPLLQREVGASQQNQAARSTLTRVREMAGEYQQLIAQGASAAPASAGNLSRIVDASVARNGLSMRRYQPSASGGAQVRFENVAFSDTLGWLHELETQHAIVIKDLSITNGSAGGLVNVSVRVSR